MNKQSERLAAAIQATDSAIDRVSDSLASAVVRDAVTDERLAYLDKLNTLQDTIIGIRHTELAKLDAEREALQ
jgi:hypothetical protein